MKHGKIAAWILVMVMALCLCGAAQAQETKSAYGAVLLGQKSATSVKVKAISLSPVPSVLGLNTSVNPNSDRARINIKTSPAGCDVSVLSITSSKPHVAQIVWENDVPYIRAVAPGKSVIAVRTTNGKVAKKTITVSKGIVKIKKIALRDQNGNTKFTYLLSGDKAGKDGSLELYATFSPVTATFGSIDGCVFTSSNEKVASATVFWEDTSALVFVKGELGTTKITATARDGSKKKATYVLTVKGYPPASISIDQGDTAMQIGTYRTLTATVRDGLQQAYNRDVVWTSSNKKVATIDATGKVRAIKAGTTKITCKSALDSTVYDTCLLTVTYSQTATGTTYRLYAIGNGVYTNEDVNDLPASGNDATLMENTLKAFNFRSENIHSAKNLNAAGMKAFLQGMVDNTAIQDNDVTVFYYSGHGMASWERAQRGALIGADYSSDNLDIMTVDTVAGYLNQVPGTVVVILDSCLSGQFIQSKSSVIDAKAAASMTNAFNADVLNAFSEKTIQSKSLTDDAVYKTKFKILTACQPLQLSYCGNDSDSLSNATGYVARGLGTTHNWSIDSCTYGNKLLADSNKDGVVTLAELYAFTNKYLARDYASSWTGKIYIQQNVMVWPSKDTTAIINTKG